MRIPVERREISDGWVLSCKGKDGNDLSLTQVYIKRENMSCRVMGGGNKLAHCTTDSSQSKPNPNDEGKSAGLEIPAKDEVGNVKEVSVLNDLRALLSNAKQFGCWSTVNSGVGKVSYASILVKNFYAIRLIINAGVAPSL